VSLESLIRRSGQTITVRRQTPSGSRDRYGQDTGALETWYTGPCYAEKMTGEERRGDRETQWHRLRVFLLAEAEGVLDSDTIDIAGAPGGNDLNIEQVSEVRNPRRGIVHHVELRTRTEI
jgi:hypothetical protein